MYSLIHTYRTACRTVAQPPGFGDFLRGSAALYQLSNKYGFNLTLDFMHHPLSQYLVQVDPVVYDDEAEVHEFFNQNNASLEPFVSRLPENSLSLVTTHCVPFSSINEGCRRFLKKRMQPNSQLKKNIKGLKHQLGQNYCVVHLRMGDHAMGAIEAVVVPFVDTWFRDCIVPEWGDRILILSDNNAIKEYLSGRFRVKFIPNTPVHLGQCGSIDFPCDGVRDSISDFFIMSKAQKIYQYSVYPWGSGFSDMCAQIYRIPLEKINPMV